MSSPRKKLKLTPKKSQETRVTSTPHVRKTQSQESRVTSTPQHSIENIISPNLSRIDSSSSGSSTSSRARTRLSDAFAEQEKENEQGSEASSSSVANGEESEKSGIVPDEDYDAYFEELGKVKYIGRVWQLYKPLKEDTVYAQLLRNPQNAQEVVIEYMLLYNEKPEVAVCKLLQLCIDMCGFQKFDVTTHYNFGDNAASRVIKLMESDAVIRDNGILKKGGRYLLMEPRTYLAKTLTMGVYNFVQKLILYTNERGVLYDEYFAVHFFSFIKHMSSSEVLPIRHTGIIFAIKVLTAVVMVYSKVINERPSENADASTESTFFIQKQDINNFLEFFYFIFIKNCHIQDQKVALMRVECIHELRIWIRYFPRIFITQLQAVNYLFKLLVDVSKQVRLAALETCESLVETPEILKILKSTMPDFTEPIGKRFYDVDINVAAKAIDIFKALLKYDESLITTHRFKLLINLVFNKCFLIAEAAAGFFVYYLEKTKKASDSMLIQLAKFSMMPRDSIKPLLVEGCLYQCPAIRHWKLYFELLYHDDVELNVKLALVRLFSEAVYQTLTGKSSKLRDFSRQVKNIDREEHIKIAKYFKLLQLMLIKYKTYPSFLVEFLRIILLIDADVLSETCQKYCNDVCDIIALLFESHDDENLLKKIAETVHFFSGIPSFSNYTKTIVNGMCSKYTKDLTNQLSRKDRSEDTDVSHKVAVLFAYFSLTKSLSWELIFDSWGAVDEVTTANLLYCCQWYLIWNLRQLTATKTPLKPEAAKQLPLLSRSCKEFTSTCFNMLQHLQGGPLQMQVFDCLCEVHIKYMEELEEATRYIRQLANLKLLIDDKQLQDLLVSVLDKYVITNTEMAVQQRRDYVVKYVNLVHSRVMPTECLAPIFKYYYAYNADFGAIIENSLTSIAEAEDENIFYMLIIHTLTSVYESILRKYGVVDLNTEGVKDLKHLVKQFLNFKAFQTPKKSFKKLLLFACKYSFRNESRYAFLYFTKYFIDLIVDKDDKSEVLLFLKQKIPKGAEKNDAVLYMAKYLKDFKPASMKKNTKPKSVPKVNDENRRPSAKKGPKKTPKKAETLKTKGGKAQMAANDESETEVSEDDLTIHDSENDDLEETLSGLKL